MLNNKDDIILTDTKSTKLDAERSKREDYKVTTINSYDCPKIEMPIDKDILTKYKINI